MKSIEQIPKKCSISWAMFLLTGGPGLLPFLTWRYYSDARAIGRSGRCRFLASRPEWKPLQWEWKPARIRDFHGIWMYSNGIQLGLMMVSLIWFSTKLAQKILVTSWDGKKKTSIHMGLFEQLNIWFSSRSLKIARRYSRLVVIHRQIWLASLQYLLPSTVRVHSYII